MFVQVDTETNEPLDAGEALNVLEETNAEEDLADELGLPGVSVGEFEPAGKYANSMRMYYRRTFQLAEFCAILEILPAKPSCLIPLMQYFRGSICCKKGYSYSVNY